MEHRERVLRAVRHESTDRMPADLHANKPVVDALIERLGVRNAEELDEALDIDFRRVCFSYHQESDPDANGYVRHTFGALNRKEPRDDGRPKTIKPFNEETTVEDVHAHPWPDPDKLDYSNIRPAIERWYGKYATYGAPWSPFFHEVGWLLGQEDYFVWMHTKPDVVEAVTAHIVDYEIEVTRRFLDACDGMLDIAYVGNDFGTQRGLFVSPKHFQRFIRPFLKRFYDLFHDYNCIVMQHSCGAIRDAIPWMIEDGVDVLDPVQVNAANMSLESLVSEFGDRLTFHGGVDTQQLLPFGSPCDVRETVRAYRELTADRGGYILSGSQNYISDIPLENILAIYDENMKLCKSAVLV